jgi:hypothetical protein
MGGRADIGRMAMAYPVRPHWLHRALMHLAVCASMLVAPAPLLAQSAPAPAPAATPAAQSSLEGRWDLRWDGVGIFRFELRRNTAGEWSGTWSRPNRFNTDGNTFGNMGGGVKTTPSMTGILFAETVELSFDDPRPGAVPDIFRFRQIDANTAEMTYVGTDLAPYRMVRAGPSDGFGNWPEGGIYRRPVPGQQVGQQAGVEARVPATAPARPAAPPARATAPGPATITIGQRFNFLDLTPRADGAGDAAARQDEAPVETPRTAAPSAEGPPTTGDAPLNVDENFLEGL